MFDDILSRAESLSSANYHTKIADISKNKKTNNSLYENAAVQGNPYSGATLDADLNSIFRASEHLWKTNAASTPIQKNFLFGEKGVIFGPTLPALKDVPAVPKSDDYFEIDEDIERINLETDRSFFNHVLLSRPQPVLTSSKIPIKETQLNRSPVPNPSLSSRRELIFAEKLRKYLRNKKKKDLCQLFSDAVKESGTDGSLAGVWAEVLALIDRKIPGDHDDLSVVSLLIEKACLFLQKLFVEHMNAQVERNLERAQRGGVPGTRGLVDAYLKIGADDPLAEDGTVEGLPVWEVTYHCLRAGDLCGAKDALEFLANFPQSAVLVACLNHLTKEDKLDIELKKKLKVEWRHNLNSARDKYKRALYATLLGLGRRNIFHGWWYPRVSLLFYSTLAFWSFERAVKLLFDCGHVSDAVHVGILAYEMGYLRRTLDAAAEMIVVDSAQLTKCSFNIARLLVSYSKEFELDDYSRALDYWFLLKGIRTPSGSDVFEMAVSRAVYLTGKSDIIIGTFATDGRRTRALIDEYIEDSSDVICRVAHDTELGGDTTQAVKLYMLANTPVKAINLLCSELSDAIRNDRMRINELRDLAEQLISGQVQIQSPNFSTLCILLDVGLLISFCESGIPEKALSISQQLRLIPIETEQVPVIVAEFHLIPDKVREVIPDLCLHLMRCMVDAIQATSSPNVKFIKQVKAIMMYAATVNYKFPQHITSKLLQLQASIAVY
ncbi:nucleoporin interacting component [Dictyocaulus viviparus]|uniref:Nuclear pore protein n=1 Tax=Dictyocaulus viviparus TaxID=29172 RepID=A0A0D8XNC5_DICVI|nr:nucleoporin interacting component [Dictyocaulus viviparus]